MMRKCFPHLRGVSDSECAHDFPGIQEWSRDVRVTYVVNARNQLARLPLKGGKWPTSLPPGGELAKQTINNSREM